LLKGKNTCISFRQNIHTISKQLNLTGLLLAKQKVNKNVFTEYNRLEEIGDNLYHSPQKNLLETLPPGPISQMSTLKPHNVIIGWHEHTPVSRQRFNDLLADKL
jgi:hypothetical protein